LIALAGALSLAFGACRAKPSMASKSAAAYAVAQKKGLPVGEGEHGGHAGAEVTGSAAHEGMQMDQATMTGQDHSAMAGNQHGAMNMPGMAHGGKAETDHAKMAGMAHGAMNMSGMKHGASMQKAIPGMEHGEMTGMQRGAAPTPGSMAGMQQGGMAGMPGMPRGARANVTVVTEAPRSSGAIANVQPNATLRSDEFDAPAAIAQSEAAKATSGAMTHKKDHE